MVEGKEGDPDYVPAVPARGPTTNPVMIESIEVKAITMINAEFITALEAYYGKETVTVNKFLSCLGDLAALSSCARRASGSPSPSRTPAARDLQPTRPGETRPATCEKILSKLQQLGTGLQQLGCLSVPCPIRVK